jgi:hypothetical protein
MAGPSPADRRGAARAIQIRPSNETDKTIIPHGVTGDSCEPNRTAVFKHKKFGELGRLVLSQVREQEMLMNAEIYKGNENPESAAAKKKREIFEKVVATVSAAFG